MVVEPSALAAMAERCQVPLRVARQALRRLADASPGELRVLVELFGRGAGERAQILASVLTPPVSMQSRPPELSESSAPSSAACSVTRLQGTERR